MPGRIDLTIPGVTLPNPIVVDTNLLAELFNRMLFPVSHVPPSPISGRAFQFFQQLRAQRVNGIVTPTVFAELIHAAIVTRYKQELKNIGGTPDQIRMYARPINNWKVLYKLDAGILKSFQPRLARLQQLLIANRLLFITHEEIGNARSQRSFDEELIDAIGRYGLDANDASILVEAERAGVTDIATLDADLQRAASNFTIYTWL